MRPLNPDHVAWKRKLLTDNIRAAYLQAKHRQITARLERMKEPVTPIQLKLPLEEVA